MRIRQGVKGADGEAMAGRHGGWQGRGRTSQAGAPALAAALALALALAIALALALTGDHSARISMDDRDSQTRMERG